MYTNSASRRQNSLGLRRTEVPNCRHEGRTRTHAAHARATSCDTGGGTGTTDNARQGSRRGRLYPTATPNDAAGRKRIRTLSHKVTYQSDGKSRNIFSKRIRTNVPFLIIMDLCAKTRAKCATDGRSRHTATAHRRTDTPVRTALRRGRDIQRTETPFTLF